MLGTLAPTIPTLDLGPACCDLLFDCVWEGHIVQSRCHLIAIFERPLKELQAFHCCCGIGRGFVEEHPCCSGNRPGIGTRLVGQHCTESVGRIPTGTCGGGPESCGDGTYGLPVLIDHLGVGEVVLLGIGIFNKADRAIGLGDVSGNAFATFGADTDWPIDTGIPLSARVPTKGSDAILTATKLFPGVL